MPDSAGEIDFGGMQQPKGMNSEILTLLDDQFGQQAAESQQAAANDQAAEAANVQGPGVPQIPNAAQQEAYADAEQPFVGPPAPPGAGVPASPPALGPFDTSPVAAAAPGVPLSAPAQTANGPDNNVAALRPMPMTQAIEADENESTRKLREAETLQEQAAQKQAQAEADAQREQQPYMERDAEIARQKVEAQNTVANWVTATHLQEAAETDEDLATAKQLMNENPNDWWGHHSTQQKVGAVLGMILAGIGGESPMGFFDRLVNQDIAAYNRKVKGFEMVQGIHQRRVLQNRQKAQDATEAIETRSIAAHQWILSAAEAKKNQSASPVAQARLDATIAALRVKVQDDINKLNNQKMERRAVEEQNAIAWAKLNLMDKLGGQKGPRDDSLPFTQTEQIDAAGPRGVPKSVGLVTKKAVGETEDMLTTTSELRRIVDEIDASGLTVPEALARSAPLRAALSGAARKMTGVGANLQGGEKQTLADGTVGIGDYAKGKVTGAGLREKLNAIEYMAAQKQKHVLLENAPNLRMSPNSPAGQVLNRTEAGQMRDAAEVQQITERTRGLDEQAKRRELTVLAKNGNLRASRMLKESGVSGMARKLLGTFGKGENE